MGIHSFTQNKSSFCITALFVCISTIGLSQNPEITFNVSTYAGGYNVSCNGASNGSIDATISGGEAPYTYLWSTGATTQDLSNKAAGTYTLTVTDNLNQQANKSVTLIQANVLQAAIQSPTYGGGFNISIYGGNNGAITSNVAGGSPPYSYSWSNGAFTGHISHITAGSYSVTITDANQCSVQKSKTLTQPTLLQITSITSSTHNGYNISCQGGSNGNINISVSGGVTPYSYNWSNGNLTEDIASLVANNYTVVVTDANGATATSNLTLTQPSAISISTTPSTYPNGYNVSCHNCFNGSITSSVSGGISPYSYLWSSGQTVSNISTLGGASYTLTVTDANSCSNSTVRTLTEPESYDWRMSGNTGMDPNNQFMGTTDNNPVAFRTNNSEVMRITPDGKVGIGTNNPLTKLDVSGQVKVSTLGYSSSNSNEIRLMGTLPTGEIKGLNIIGFAPDFPISSCINPSLAWFNSTCSGANPNHIFKQPLEGYLGIGTDNPQAKIDIVSDGSSNSTSAFQIKNFNSTSLLNIRDDGKIGIGEANPTEKLTVNGNVYLTGTILGKQNYGTLFINGNTGSSDGGTVELYGQGSSASSEVHLIGKSIKFYDYQGPNQWDLNMTINSMGDVGIGTEYPSGRFHVVTKNNDQNHIAFQVTNSSGSNLLSVRDNGQIGINWDFNTGTPGSNSDYKLAVNGGIISTFSRVQLSGEWQDYVFKDDYELMAISELKEFIDQNNHLPGIPTEEQVKQDGIDLGQMNQILLEKVEELTLYLILLQNQIDELKNK